VIDLWFNGGTDSIVLVIPFNASILIAPTRPIAAMMAVAINALIARNLILLRELVAGTVFLALDVTEVDMCAPARGTLTIGVASFPFWLFLCLCRSRQQEQSNNSDEYSG